MRAVSPSHPRALRVEDYVAGVLGGNRSMLARAITLIESNAPGDAARAEEVVRELLPHAGKSIRVGITGVPGVGKSTFIESLGCMLCRGGRHLAVLAVDPSSTLSRGSILADKTRMEMLTREPNCFIRPSPTGGALGGVARKSRETMLLCEAAGFDVVLVETVGVGQSETTVRSMVDFFLLLMLAGAGDELQGIKKGIIELADALVITKADGDNASHVEAARAEFSRVLHYLMPPDPLWHPPVLTCSSFTGAGIGEVWEVVNQFQEAARKSGAFAARRHAQTLDWMREMLTQELWRAFTREPHIVSAQPGLERQVLDGKLSATAAVSQLLALYRNSHDPKN
jgi:LAO/AO transport system kinase